MRKNYQVSRESHALFDLEGPEPIEIPGAVVGFLCVGLAGLILGFAAGFFAAVKWYT